jgi:hypothetical protein
VVTFQSDRGCSTKKRSGASALASVLVDRAVGLYGLVVLSTASLALMPNEKLTPLLTGIRNGGIILCIVGAVGLAISIIGGRTFDWIEKFVQRFRMSVGPCVVWLGHYVFSSTGQR